MIAKIATKSRENKNRIPTECHAQSPGSCAKRVIPVRYGLCRRRAGVVVLLIAAVALGTSPLALADTTTANAPAHKTKVIVGGALATAHSDTAETTAGDLVADAVRESGNADIAFVSADELVTDKNIAPGSYTSDNLLDILRYSQDPTDTVMVLDLTGKQVVQALERSISRMPHPFDGFLQVSGVQFRFDAAKPAGKRIMEASIPGAPISDTKRYRVAVTRALAGGSFGYFRVWEKSSVVDDTGVSVAKSLTDYAGLHTTLSPMIDGRIVGL